MLGTITLTVEQQEPSMVNMDSIQEENMEVVSNDAVSKQNTKEDGQTETPETNDIEQMPEEKESTEQANESQSSEVGFKKVFKFVGFKFTVKKDKTEKSDPVQLITIKKDEAALNGTSDHEPHFHDSGEGKTETVEEVKDIVQQTESPNGFKPDVESADETCVAQVKEELSNEILKKGEESEVEMNKKSPESSTNTTVTETSSPFRRFFTQGWAGLRKKTSLKKSKEEDLQGEEKQIKEQDTTEPPATSNQDDAEATDTREEHPSPVDLSKPETPKEDSNLFLEENPQVPHEEPKTEEIFEKTEVTSQIDEITVPVEENKKVSKADILTASVVLSEIQTEAHILEVQLENQINDATAPLSEEINQLQSNVAVEQEASANKQPQMTSNNECANLEKSLDILTTESELLSSQERAKVQGSPLKKLFSSSGLRKLSGKKSKGKKEDSNDAKVDTTEEPAPALSASPEAREVTIDDSSPSSPDESVETVPVEKPVEETLQAAETEGEGATSDSERKKDGITPWASFKKLVTPKRRPKRLSESDKEEEVEKTKTLTLSSTDSAGSVENQEETKETCELEKSTEENKKKVDSSVSWDALICVGSSKKRARRTSDSDEEEIKSQEEVKKTEEEVDQAKGDDLESPITSLQEQQAQESPSPDQYSSPTEEDGVSTWQSFKRLVTPRRRSKTKAEEKAEETAAVSSVEQSTSDGEASKDESWVSLKKLIPGRKKKKSDAKQDSAPPSTDLPVHENGEDESEEPAVVPLAEFDAAELEKLEDQKLIPQPVSLTVSNEPKALSQQANEEPIHAITVTLIEGMQAASSLEDRSPSWISTNVVETVEHAKQIEQTTEIIKSEITVQETVVFSSVSQVISETQSSLINEAELTSEALTALEEAIETSFTEETTSMMSAVSQLGESIISSATPVPEDDADLQNSQEQELVDDLLNTATESAELSLDVQEPANFDLVDNVLPNLEEEIRDMCTILTTEISPELVKGHTEKQAEETGPVSNKVHLVESLKNQEYESASAEVKDHVPVATWIQPKDSASLANAFQAEEATSVEIEAYAGEAAPAETVVQAEEGDSVAIEVRPEEISPVATKVQAEEDASVISGVPIEESVPVATEVKAEDASVDPEVQTKDASVAKEFQDEELVPVAIEGQSGEGAPAALETQDEEGAPVATKLKVEETALEATEAQAEEYVTKAMKMQAEKGSPVELEGQAEEGAHVITEVKVVEGAPVSTEGQAEGPMAMKMQAEKGSPVELEGQAEEGAHVITEVKVVEGAPVSTGGQAEEVASVATEVKAEEGASVAIEVQAEGVSDAMEMQTEEGAPTSLNVLAEEDSLVAIEIKVEEGAPVVNEVQDENELQYNERASVTNEVQAEESVPAAIELEAEEGAFVEMEVHAKEVAPIASEVQTEDGAPEAMEVQAKEDAPVATEVQAEEGASMATEVQAEESALVATEVQDEEGVSVVTDVQAVKGAPVATEVQDNGDALVATEVQTEEGASMAPEVQAQGASMATEVRAKYDVPVATVVPAEDVPLASEVQAEEGVGNVAVAMEVQDEEDAPVETVVQAEVCVHVATVVQAEEGAPKATEVQAKEDAPVATEVQAEEDAYMATQVQAEEGLPMGTKVKAKEGSTVAIEVQAEEDASVAINLQAEEGAAIAIELQSKESASLEMELQAKEGAPQAIEVAAEEGAIVVTEVQAKEGPPLSMEVQAEEGAHVAIEVLAEESAPVTTEVQEEEGDSMATKVVLEEGSPVATEDQVEVPVAMQVQAKEEIHMEKEAPVQELVPELTQAEICVLVPTERQTTDVTILTEEAACVPADAAALKIEADSVPVLTKVQDCASETSEDNLFHTTEAHAAEDATIIKKVQMEQCATKTSASKAEKRDFLSSRVQTAEDATETTEEECNKSISVLSEVQVEESILVSTDALKGQEHAFVPYTMQGECSPLSSEIGIDVDTVSYELQAVEVEDTNADLEFAKANVDSSEEQEDLQNDDCAPVSIEEMAEISIPAKSEGIAAEQIAKTVVVSEQLQAEECVFEIHTPVEMEDKKEPQSAVSKECINKDAPIDLIEKESGPFVSDEQAEDKEENTSEKVIYSADNYLHNMCTTSEVTKMPTECNDPGCLKSEVNLERSCLIQNVTDIKEELVTTYIPEVLSTEAVNVSDPVTAASVEEQMLAETLKPIESSADTATLTKESAAKSQEDDQELTSEKQDVVESVSQKAAAIVDAAIEAATNCVVVNASSEKGAFQKNTVTKRLGLEEENNFSIESSMIAVVKNLSETASDSFFKLHDAEDIYPKGENQKDVLISQIQEPAPPAEPIKIIHATVYKEQQDASHKDVLIFRVEIESKESANPENEGNQHSTHICDHKQSTYLVENASALEEDPSPSALIKSQEEDIHNTSINTSNSNIQEQTRAVES